MDRSSSSGSIRGITAPNTSPSGEEKVTEKAKNKNKQPAMVSKDDKKDAASKRAAYAQSKDSSQTKPSQNLPRFKEEEKSSSQSSSRVSSASASSSESQEETTLPSTAPTLSASSSTTQAASNSSASAVNPEWARFNQNLLEHNGRFIIFKNMDVNAVCQWLASSPAGINVLHFESRRITDLDVNYLTTALEKNTTLKFLRLLFNSIGSDGAKAIAEALKVNKTLTNLNMSCNDIGDDGVKALAAALKVNTTLTELDISHNNIGDDGAKALAAALIVNTTLTSLFFHPKNLYDPISTQSIESELEKNRQLLKEKESAKLALEFSNGEIGKTIDPGHL